MEKCDQYHCPDMWPPEQIADIVQLRRTMRTFPVWTAVAAETWMHSCHPTALLNLIREVL